jgi:hypothetical protein
MGLASLLAACAISSTAGEHRDSTKLFLKSAYLAKAIGGGGVRQVFLQVALDHKGGKGLLTLDTNTFTLNEFGDPTTGTLVLVRPINVSLKALEAEDPAKEGRRLYEIQGAPVGGRLLLVVPGKRARPYRLVSQGQDGAVQQVVPLEPYAPAGK